MVILSILGVILTHFSLTQKLQTRIPFAIGKENKKKLYTILFKPVQEAREVVKLIPPGRSPSGELRRCSRLWIVTEVEN